LRRIADEQPIISSDYVEHPAKSSVGLLATSNDEWKRVRRELEKARVALSDAKAEEPEDFQHVGLGCRELLRSVALAVYDPERHPPPEGDLPLRPDDTKGMLGHYIEAELANERKELRAVVRTAAVHAEAVTHRREGSRLQAELCVTACDSVMTMIESIERAAPAKAPAVVVSGPEES
jgi:hypothetical protein